MFARFVTLLPLAALAAVAAAAPNALEARTGSTCSSGSEYCCNQKLTNPITFEKGLIGALLGVNAAVQCSPVGVISPLSNGAQCTQQTVCCSNVKQNGLVNVACVPIAVPV